MGKIIISHISISPGTVSAKGSVKVSVDVEDRAENYQKVIEYAKEIYSGEQIGVV